MSAPPPINTIKKYDHLPSSSFTWDIYIGTLGYADAVWDYDTNTPAKGFSVIGYADASNIPCRPRVRHGKKTWAIMLEDSHSESLQHLWFHCYTEEK